ncbi:MAG: hypothetical protein QME58_10665 [Bacteroidota bacterium]|nr:hypothetical protein [Bacteroidota bacterium]
MYEKPDKFIPAIYGGIIIGIISSVPFLNLINCLCCAGIMGGGVLAVFFYKQNYTPDTQPFSKGDCLTVGVYAGIVGAFVGTVLDVVFLMTFGNVVGQFVMDNIQNMDIEIPEESLEAIKQAFQETTSIYSVMFSLISSLILNSIFGLLGGLIGYNIFKPKQTMIQPPYEQNV